MKQYHDLLRKIREEGEERGDRTGTGTLSVFAPQLKFDLREGFPVVTTKKVFTRMPFEELFWMLSGSRNIQPLVQKNINIWNEWPFVPYLKSQRIEIPEQDSEEWNRLMAEYAERIATDDAFAGKYGDLGPVYGYQWRHWQKPGDGEVDQVADVQHTLRSNALDRRLIVSAWNAGEIRAMQATGLPPCHMMYQFYASADGKWLDMQMYQRSADMFLGVPFNIAQYALLLSMMAQATGRKPRELTITFGDAHIYQNHLEQVDEQLSREPRPLPQLKLDPSVTDVFDFRLEHVELVGYDPHPVIKAPVAI